VAENVFTGLFLPVCKMKHLVENYGFVYSCSMIGLDSVCKEAFILSGLQYDHCELGTMIQIFE